MLALLGAFRVSVPAQPLASAQCCRHAASSLQAIRQLSALPCVQDEAPQPPSLPQPRFKALLLDAAGTLLSPSENAAEVYLRYARDYGCKLTERQVLQRFRRSYNTPWGNTARRYIGDGRDFWHHIVTDSTGCSDAKLSEDLYQYYSTPEAWSVAPHAVSALCRLQDAGIKLAVVSNFDTRLRPLLSAMRLDVLFDAILVSAEVGAEKPNPVIFEAACEALGVKPCEAVHVGDDRRNDVFGARDAGCFAWMYGLDVLSMDEVADRILYGNEDDDAMWAIAH